MRGKRKRKGKATASQAPRSPIPCFLFLVRPFDCNRSAHLVMHFRPKRSYGMGLSVCMDRLG
jgi:hypothetical protein